MILFGLVFALLLTIFLEFFVLWLILKKEPTKLLLYFALINSFSQPLATFAYWTFLPDFFLVEAAVFLAETVLIALLLQTNYRKALLLSFAANAVSAAFSFLL